MEELFARLWEIGRTQAGIDATYNAIVGAVFILLAVITIVIAAHIYRRQYDTEDKVAVCVVSGVFVVFLLVAALLCSHSIVTLYVNEDYQIMKTLFALIGD